MLRQTLSSLPTRLVSARISASGVRAATNMAAVRGVRGGARDSRWAARLFSTSGNGGGAMFAASTVVGAAGAGGEVPNFFALKVKDHGRREVNLSQYANKVVLVVNVASDCGFTEQYEGLEKLYNDYKDRGLVVIGFPCNQFGGQEPGTNEEIQTFCKLKYGVTFPVMDKIDVNGDNEDPVYAFLKSQKSGLMGLTRIKWNFEKFLVNKDGTVYQRYSSAANPSSIASDIEKLLGSA